MRYKLFPLFVTVLVCALSAATQTVIESESSVVIKERTVAVSLVVDSKASSSRKIALEILDSDGKVRTSLDQAAKLRPGRQTLSLSMPIGDLMKKSDDEVAWFRLRYRIGDTAGIISLSELLKEDFELRAAVPRDVVSGVDYRIRLHAINPFTKKNIRKVVIEATLTLELNTDAKNDQLIVKATATTGSDGLAVLNFKIPEGAKLSEDGEVTVVGRKNGIVREIKEDLDTDENKGSVFLTTDKPIYQPGQDFNVRGLFFDKNHTVVSGNELEFTIKDEDETVLYREKVNTSEYGIAAITWKIPENAKLGDYHVEVEADDDLERNAIPFKVSRYDLPAFSVSAAPNKSFYLTSDGHAEIAINADYLFGKPVTKGKVKLVEQDERKWNWREQKYDVDESWSTEGVADANGKYVAEFDLADEFQRLNAKSWQRFVDLHFAAYFTDLTTNRTEQRRFDIRLSKEPIHVYLFINSRNNVNLPITGYVSTFYADGTPAICNVEINGNGALSERFKTNDLGAGKFSFDIPAGSLSNRRYDFKINARDKRGQVGTMDEDLYLDADDVMQIETDQTIYKPGDPITLKVSSTRQRGLVYVDVVKDSAIIGAYSINMRNGRAEIQIPFQPNFKGELTIGAYTDLNTSYWDDTMRASRGVVFPERRNLSLGAKFSSASYHPGEDASVKFSILDGGGRSTESALGIVVFDKAVEERAKTDAGFGSYFAPYDSLIGYQKSFGSLSLKDLNDLDTSKPISPETQLAAEIMLAGNYYYPRIYHSSDSETEADEVYADFFRKQLAPVNFALNDQYAKDRSFANDTAELEEILARYNIKFSDLVDPWGQQYQVVISTDRTYGSVTLRSSGADKKPGTSDDFDVATNRFQYFVSTGSLIDKAVSDYHVRTGGYIRDIDNLKAELALSGFDLGKMKDRWGRDYQIKFGVSGRDYVIKISSLGPNGVLEANRVGDDFDVWSSYIDYFLETEGGINLILSKNVNYGKKPFPKTNEEFSELLRQNGLDLKSVKDGYGQPAYLASTVEAQYSDRTVIENGKTKITPVTNQIRVFTIRSLGADAVDSADDADLARFSTILTEHFAGPMSSQAEVRSLAYSGSRGAIRGTVTDPNGAVVSNSNITATDQDDPTKTYTTVSGTDGQFLLQNLPSGRYSVEAVSPGFQRFKYENVFVRSMNLIEINIILQIGGATATVDVTATADINQTSSASISKTITTVKGLGRITFGYPDQTSTPRLRNYFPETLLWNPELITDKKGKAELKFKLADNITTWKMYAIASTKNGKIGVAEKEVTAFQPFFVDLDPPKFLTEGDEIYLPSQVRNYTDNQQKVDVTMSKSDWFSMLGSEKQQIDVKAGDSQNAVFGFKAESAIKDGKQRVTAIAQSDSDAIEKPVTVRPNGQEVVHTDSNLFTGEEKLNLTFPANALPKTQKAELKIYPNLYSQISESVEGLLERPYGCGEQTISSTYPNLMVLKFVKPDSALAAKAKRYLQKGYERLIGYQVADGGFSYWGGKDTSDIGLTAYALRFLTDASSKIDVDQDVIKKAESWLLKQQRSDGGWTQKYRWENNDDPNRAKITTTYVARTLAMLSSLRVSSPTVREGSTQTPANNDQRTQALTKALAYLKTRNAEIDEPYALALFGLASLDSGDAQTAASVAKTLESMAIAEGNSVYWKLETNTPFYGWGTAGRVETTALVTQLLIRMNQKEPNAERQALISKGTLFLLKNKDRYGVWYSTQTTINVLDAFLASLGTERTAEPQKIDVFLNGEQFRSLDVAPDRFEAVTLDLTGKLGSSNNIEVRSSGNSPVMSQLVASHYIDWKDSDATNTNVNQSRALSLDYKCDKTTAAIMQEVNCSVKAERIGFKGYGMLLAEIGTPPGADVSRESLESAIQSDWSISHYEILPDRIVVYMWSKAGGTSFNFKFHPRYGINAQTPASVVYDYYNPEAQAIVAPLKFVVK